MGRPSKYKPEFDELVRRYPHLVRPRTELGRFAPITREVRNATAG